MYKVSKENIKYLLFPIKPSNSGRYFAALYMMTRLNIDLVPTSLGKMHKSIAEILSHLGFVMDK